MTTRLEFLNFADPPDLANVEKIVISKTCKSKIDVLFDRLFEQVDRLLAYHIYGDWLPLQRCQISFYSQTITDENYRYQLIDIIALSNH